MESKTSGGAYPLPLRTRDGASFVVRPIEAADRDALREAFERLSPTSRYRRFMSPIGSLSESQLGYLTDVDHHDHEALIAATPEGDGIGVARFVRSRDEPESAEVAVAVADDWQARGVGTALLTALSERAREEGVRRFTATALAENREIVELLRQVGGVRTRAPDRGTFDMAVELDEPPTLELEFDLPHAGAGGALGRALRAAAAGHLRPPGWQRIEESARALRERLR